MRLSDKYPFLTNYFTNVLKSEAHPFPQTILFYGNDLESQYELATEIARLVNCKNDGADDCDCLNCKWIMENTHPAVRTISRLDNKPEDDSSKQVISIKQSAMIKEQLMNDSEFHRVYIFCDKDDEGNVAGLNSMNFQEEVANSLLKSIEEPQPRITFIFLTRYIEDLLATIVSRSQCFFVPSFKDVNYDYSSIVGLFDNYWTFARKDVFDVSMKLQKAADEKGVGLILDGIQNYILSVLKSNPHMYELIKHIEVLENCKYQAKLGIKSQNIFDDMCLKLIK